MSASEEKKGEIRSLVDQINIALDRAAENAKDLIKKIEPVTRSVEVPPEASQVNAESANTALGADLLSIVYRLDQLAQTLEVTAKAVDL